MIFHLRINYLRTYVLTIYHLRINYLLIIYLLSHDFTIAIWLFMITGIIYKLVICRSLYITSSSGLELVKWQALKCNMKLPWKIIHSLIQYVPF